MKAGNRSESILYMKEIEVIKHSFIQLNKCFELIQK